MVLLSVTKGGGGVLSLLYYMRTFGTGATTSPFSFLRTMLLEGIGPWVMGGYM